MIRFAPEIPPSGRCGLDERQKTTYEAKPKSTKRMDRIESAFGNDILRQGD